MKPIKTNQSKGTKHEVRILSNTKMSLRKADDGISIVAGYFATFGTLSHDMGFRERLIQGCFSESLQTRPVQCLFNHDTSKLLGRTESGTLEVSEDNKGLRFKVQLPNTSYANDLVSLLERGDSFECSFGFFIPDGGDEWSNLPDGQLLRTITRAEIVEGSILVSPAAYPNTSANLRSLPAALRAKLKRGSSWGEDDDICDPDSPNYDPDACDEDQDFDDSDDENRCLSYRAAQACTCGKVDCMSLGESTADEDRARQIDLVLRRLRS